MRRCVERVLIPYPGSDVLQAAGRRPLRVGPWPGDAYRFARTFQELLEA